MALTLNDILAELVDNSSMGSDDKFRLNKAISALPVSGSGPVTAPPVSGPLTVTTASLPDASVGSAYVATLTATGGAAPYTAVVAGLPAGLTATAAGEITGTPSVAGTSPVTAIVTDSSTPAQTAVVTLTLAVA